MQSNYNFNKEKNKLETYINSIHKDISNIDKLDYIKSTKWAIEKRLSDGNFCAWVCAKKLGICN